MNKTNLEFPVTIYGEVKNLNDVLSKARCRIFYKGANRNGTFITDDFAEELVSTLQYVPVKGIYNGSDYTDHGKKRDEGRIYGIVPESNNFSWEQHLDEDGVSRLYACTDVYLFTALYPEASEIIGKKQSMELYIPSIKYHIEIIDGQRYVVFDHGCFLGLQALGENVKPCFEGAAFFSLQESIDNIIKMIKECYTKGGESDMPNINFKLSDGQKYSKIWKLLNPNCNEENNWVCDYSICEVYDDYALVLKYETGEHFRVPYTKDSEDNITIGEFIKVFIVDVTEKEKDTLDTLEALNGNTYELVNPNLLNADQNASDCAEFSAKNEELDNLVSTLKTEIENIRTDYTELKAQYDDVKTEFSTLTDENESLKAYKKNVENQQKNSVINEYTDKLAEDIISEYKAKFDEYTVEDLDMHLAYELKKTNSSVFSQNNSGRLPKDISRSGVEDILARYKR